jgi:hypothetical protein
MIQEVINNITTAELEAEEIIKIATTKAKDVRLSAEVQAEQIKKSASKESREVVKLMQGNAEVVCVKRWKCAYARATRKLSRMWRIAQRRRTKPSIL